MAETWRVHVVGPDEIHEYPDLESALVAQLGFLAGALANERNNGELRAQFWANVISPSDWLDMTVPELEGGERRIIGREHRSEWRAHPAGSVALEGGEPVFRLAEEDVEGGE